ncbi:hypothetical protein F5B22DRAFT_490442 [Xylaria bambusicola]|uniref:uncharacterized protein n=1 Tax=Xylaria bambusicola TaxID=326684 RepID=UPI002007CF8D|nr:uncharacterized protein F5B22DRAFT_490442 [Xylaria bambusicola]KAI0505897.1 hypothetical protein F5B22DRAFT_490442 [Xylaria bambusicola]
MLCCVVLLRVASPRLASTLHQSGLLSIYASRITIARTHYCTTPPPPPPPPPPSSSSSSSSHRYRHYSHGGHYHCFPQLICQFTHPPKQTPTPPITAVGRRETFHTYLGPYEVPPAQVLSTDVHMLYRIG